jgi:hypothetical protein
VVLYAFYLFTSEYCHCQPDVWMLLPPLAALHLRRHQLARLTTAAPGYGTLVTWSLAEGLCWGAGCLIKPYVALPGLACWLVSTAVTWRASAQAARRLAADTAGLLLGGLLAGGAWLLWLVQSGALPYFRETVRDWNSAYYSSHKVSWLQRTWTLFVELRPWGYVHLLAVTFALAAVLKLLLPRSGKPASGADALARAEGLLGAFYLAWLFQAVYVQWALPYHLVPPVLLALTFLVSWAARVRLRRAARAGFVVLAALVVAKSLVFEAPRLALWGRCWREGGSPEVRNSLARVAGSDATDWVHLARVAEFLRGQGIRDGELTCYHRGTIPLYLELGVQPSTRLVWIDILLLFFPGHMDEIRSELAHSGQRYIVSDLGGIRSKDSTWAVSVGQDQSLALPPDFPRDWATHYPWSEPIVFRSGRYLVHRATGPVGTLTGIFKE